MNKSIFMKITICLCCMAIVAGLYTFVAIPQVKEQEKKNYDNALAAYKNDYVSVLVYVGDKPLLKGTILTSVISSNFEIIEINSSCVNSYVVNDYESIEGMQLKYDVVQGQHILSSMIKKYEKDVEKDKTLKDFKVVNLVGRYVVTGNYVDIIVEYGNGKYDVVIPHIQIYNILTNEKNEYSMDKDGNFTIMLYLTEEEYRDLRIAEMHGKLDTRLYISENTTASIKTFDVSQFI